MGNRSRWLKRGLSADLLCKACLYAAMASALGFLLGSDVVQWEVGAPFLFLLGGSWLLPPEIRAAFSGKWATRFLFFFFPFYFADWFLISREFFAATVHMTLIISLIKMCSLSAPRDYVFLLLIGTSQVMAASIITGGLEYAVIILFFLSSAVGTLILLEVQRGMAAAARASRGPNRSAAVDSEVRLSLLPFAMICGSFTLLVMLLAIPLFFVLPRLPYSLYARSTYGENYWSGFTDRVVLGEFGNIRSNNAVVMRVRLEERIRERPAHLRWRGMVLDRYDGKTWSQSPSQRSRLRRAPGRDYYEMSPPGREARLIGQTILLQPLATPVLFSLPRACLLREESATAANPILQDRMGVLWRGAVAGSIQRYQVWSDARRASADQLRSAPRVVPTASPTVRAYYNLPAIDPRMRRLAEDLTRGIENDYDKAVRIESYLKQNHRYTTQMGIGAQSADPLAAFLFETREGHCEYFASAMVVLLRLAGVPCRMVNGFLGGDYNEIGDAFIVRQAHAHVWVEVFFPGESWVEFDPTPSASDPAAYPGLGAWMTKVWDAAELYWEETVLRYNWNRQIQFMAEARRSLMGGLFDLTRRVQDYRRQLENQAGLWFAGTGRRLGSPIGWIDSLLISPLRLGLLLFGLLMLGGSGWMAWRRWRGRIFAFRRKDGAEGCYLELLAELGKRGPGKAPGQTPWEYAQTFEGRDFFADVSAATTLYYRSRYRREGATGGLLTEMRRLLQAIRARKRPAGKESVPEAVRGRQRG